MQYLTLVISLQSHDLWKALMLFTSFSLVTRCQPIAAQHLKQLTVQDRGLFSLPILFSLTYDIKRLLCF